MPLHFVSANGNFSHMGNNCIQQIRLVFLKGGSEPSTPPGNPRLWDVLRDSLGDVSCLRGLNLFIEWENSKKVPDLDQWTKWLCWKGVHIVELDKPLDTVSLQLRKKGLECDAYVTLVEELLQRNGFDKPKNCWLARYYDFRIDGEEVKVEKSDLLVDAIKKIIELGAKSGIFHPAVEDARYLLPEDNVSWPTGSLDQGVKYAETLSESLKSGRWSVMRKNFELTELRPRIKKPIRVELKNPLTTIMHSDMTFDNSSNRGGFSPAPLNFIVSLSKNPDRFSNFGRFRAKCEFLASHYDRSMGNVIFRRQTASTMVFDVLSPLPLNHKNLESCPGPEYKLCLVGPWDARNTILERRIEWWAKEQKIESTYKGEVVDGEQDWLAHLLLVVSPGTGWEFDLEGASQLFKHNSVRTRYHRAWFLWVADGFEKIKASAESIGLSFLKVGVPSKSGRVFLPGKPSQKPFIDQPIGDFAMENSDREVTREVIWNYPELKSPTYGFERVTQFPYEYLERMCRRDAAMVDWYDEARLRHSGDTFRSVFSRNQACIPLNSLRWTDGNKVYVDSVGCKEGFIDVDPRAAGLASFDAAIRGLVAMGAEPQGGVASIWSAQPEGNEGNEENSKTWAAYLMSLEGACMGAKAFDFKLHYINGGGISFPGSKHEVYVNLRSKMGERSPLLVPGFRLEGELIYAVGPRPAFVDVGSHILTHVQRVISNNIMKLVPETQLKFYQLIFELIQKGLITSIRSVGDGGIAEAIAEMALWSGRGIQMRPSLATIELYSGAAGRFLVGVLPQDGKKFESLVQSEVLTHIGTVGGEKVMGLTLSRLIEVRGGLKS